MHQTDEKHLQLAMHVLNVASKLPCALLLLREQGMLMLLMMMTKRLIH